MIGIFTSHGSPMVLVEENKWKKVWKEMGERIRREFDPETVIVMSPHFVSWRGFRIEVQKRLGCIHDYYGFPDELYKFYYSADNDVNVAIQILEISRKKGFNINEDTSWGLDHGAWIPLLYMFPDGIKTVVLSISADSGLKDHYRLGEIVAEIINDKRILVMGTGSPTHRLDLYYLGEKGKKSEFDAILLEMLQKGDIEGLFKLKNSKAWLDAQPEGELKPLFFVLGSVKSKKAEIIEYDTPWSGVSMVMALFF